MVFSFFQVLFPEIHKLACNNIQRTSDVGMLEKVDRSSLLEDLKSRQALSTQPREFYGETLKTLQELDSSWFADKDPSSLWSFKSKNAIQQAGFLVDLGRQELISLHLAAMEEPAYPRHDFIISVYEVLRHLSTYSATLDRKIFKELSDSHPDGFSIQYRWKLLVMLNSEQAGSAKISLPNFLSDLQDGE